MFSPAHGTVKASTALVPGAYSRGLKRGQCVFRGDAKRSTVWHPYLCCNPSNAVADRRQSSRSDWRERTSAQTLATDGSHQARRVTR